MLELLLTLHLLASLILFFLIPKNLVSFFFFFPGMGAVGLMALYFFTNKKKLPEEIMELEEDWLALKDLPKPMPETSMSRTGRIFEELDLMSLSEILLTSDLDLKRGAIEKLALLKTTEAIELLLRHRSDPSTEVRFYVTSALEKIKRDFDEELETGKNQMKKNPADAAMNRSMSGMYLQYIRSGLLDESTAHLFEREAFYHLNQAISSGTNDPETYRTLIALYRKQSEWNRAVGVLNRLEQAGLASKQEISKERAQIFYESGRYAEMMEELGQLKGKEEKDPTWVALANWWIG